MVKFGLIYNPTNPQAGILTLNNQKKKNLLTKKKEPPSPPLPTRPSPPLTIHHSPLTNLFFPLFFSPSTVIDLQVAIWFVQRINSA